MIKYLATVTVLLLTVSAAQAASPLTDGQLDRVTAGGGYVPPGGDGSAPGVLGVQVNTTALTPCGDGCFPIVIEGKFGVHELQIQILSTSSGVHSNVLPPF